MHEIWRRLLLGSIQSLEIFSAKKVTEHILLSSPKYHLIAAALLSRERTHPVRTAKMLRRPDPRPGSVGSSDRQRRSKGREEGLPRWMHRIALFYTEIKARVDSYSPLKDYTVFCDFWTRGPEKDVGWKLQKTTPFQWKISKSTWRILFTAIADLDNFLQIVANIPDIKGTLDFWKAHVPYHAKIDGLTRPLKAAVGRGIFHHKVHTNGIDSVQGVGGCLQHGALHFSYTQDKKVHERASAPRCRHCRLWGRRRILGPLKGLGIVRGKNMPKMDCACDDSVITQDFMSLKKKLPAVSSNPILSHSN